MYVDIGYCINSTVNVHTHSNRYSGAQGRFYMCDLDISSVSQDQGFPYLYIPKLYSCTLRAKSDYDMYQDSDWYDSNIDLIV